jgi:hypothetical protein
MKIREKSMLNYAITFFLIIFSITTLWSQPVVYHSYSDLKETLKKLSDEYSKIIHLKIHGETYGEKEIFSLTLSTGNPESKPAILLVAGVNGMDLSGTEVLIQFALSIAQNYGKVDSITKLIDNTTIYIFPQVNPDASASFFSKPQYERSLNIRPMDLDTDGRMDEDGYDDLNKDGQITWLRITEPGGEWIEDSDYPALLKKADIGKGETGVYRLIREGVDNDGDGAFNEDEPGGVNFNQNFTFRYKFFTPGSGFHQISEVETRAIADFAFNHPNIVVVFSFSPNDNLNHPWEAPKGPPKKPERGSQQPIEQIDEKDAPYFAHISETFKNLTDLSDLLPSESGQGAFNEWVYYHFGRWSFSTPSWWPPLIESKSDTSSASTDTSKVIEKKKFKQSSQKTGGESKKTNAQRLWDWIQSTNQKDAFIQWTEIKHPDFPGKKVEIGGFKPFPVHNPPADSLMALSNTYYPFLIKLSSWLPRIDVVNLKVEDLYNNVYRISLNVVNRGYLPTNTQIGVLNKWCPKIKLALDLSENQQIVSGRVLQFIDRLEGSGGNKEISWMVMGKKGESLKLSVGSPMTGTLVKEVNLQ